MVQFDTWFAEAMAAGVPQAEAMAVATADADGRPSVRMVLLKAWGPGGFVFYTSADSRKGTELRASGRAALMMFWQTQGRQVRIEGRVDEVDRANAEAYFRARPRGSQIAAAVSAQSRPIASRDRLEAAFRALSDRLAGAEVPVPETWTGFRVDPDAFEFWEHREDRLHDRAVYERSAGGWSRRRLQP